MSEYFLGLFQALCPHCGMRSIITCLWVERLLQSRGSHSWDMPVFNRRMTKLQWSPSFYLLPNKMNQMGFFLHSFQKVISIKQPWIPFVDSAPKLYGTFSLKFILIMSSYSSYSSVRFIIFNHILSSYNSCVAVCELCYSAFFSLSSGCCQVRHNKVGYFCPILQPQILHWHLNIIPSDTVRQK